jgi:hypothetical protein
MNDMLEQTLKKVALVLTIIAVLVALIALMILFKGTTDEPPVGSVAQSSEYHATTTYSGVPKHNYLAYDSLSTQGTLGSIIVTKVGAGTTMNYIYDATTTNALKRAATMSTTSIIMATWPGNLATGTYTFDTVYLNGLLFENTDGGLGTTTITFR